jgi:hypothetical protein
MRETPPLVPLDPVKPLRGSFGQDRVTLDTQALMAMRTVKNHSENGVLQSSLHADLVIGTLPCQKDMFYP